ncbi:T9SS type A sorting domain-containing protein [candidate division WOR-3 bacterium]|nr:T9SS type A sorting domain-containing protein [candidate division WOR-3 bacterium]
MKKFCFIIVLSLFSFRVYCINFLCPPAVTITTADVLDIWTSFGGGDSIAKSTMYYDINDDGQLDPNDSWIMKFKLIDGGFDDEDEIVNALHHLIRDPITFSGKFILYAEDNGGSDTVSVTVNPVSSSHSVSGKVTNPANQPHILVTTIKIIDKETLEYEYGYGDFTDANGDYSISIPEEYADQYWNIIAIDIADVCPFYSSNDIFNDSIYVSGAVTKNLAMCLAPTGTITELTGELRDDLGNLIKEPAQVKGIGLPIDGCTRARPGNTDSTGTYKVSMKKVTSGAFYLYMIDAGIAEQFYPEFMNPVRQQQMGMPGSPNTITLNLKAYRTTNTISGYVYKSGVPYDGCQLDCGGIDYGGTYTKTFSDGCYEMPVSDSASSYTITIARKSIPEGYEVTPDEQTAAPGDTGINFNLIKVGIKESSKPQLGITLSVYPNPFMSKVVFELSGSERVGKLVLYDIAGNRVTEVKPETQNGLTRFILSSGNKKLPTGIYFYSLRAGNKVLKGKVIKLR